MLLTQCVLVSAITVLVRAQIPLVIDRQWEGGFESSFTVHADQRIGGWMVNLMFDSPVQDIQVWKGIVVNSTNGGKVYMVKNQTWDGNLSPGRDIIVEFQGYIVSGGTLHGSYRVDGYNGTSVIQASAQTPDGSFMKYDYHEALRLSILYFDAQRFGSFMKYDYHEALRFSILFFDAQRSGKLPKNNPIPWRGDSGLNDSDKGHDLTGGWYDAGDNVKFNYPMGAATIMLEWGFLVFKDGYAAAGQTNMMCDMIKWPLEYFLKCWIPSQNTLYVQVGDGTLDHNFWGRPEDMTMDRPALQVNASCPGSDVAANIASSLAAGYIIYNDICGDSIFATKLLTAAKSLFTFATTYKGTYTSCLKQQPEFYGSDDFRDEVALAGLWLYRATNTTSYLDQARQYQQSGYQWSLNWGSQMMAANLILYEITGDDKYKTDVTNFMSGWMPGGDVPQTPCGLAYRNKWGVLRYAGNTAMLALIAAADGINPEVYKRWSLSQINYILGDNNYNISYEIGFGDKYPTHYHHRGSSCRINSQSCDINNPGSNPNLLKGGLVGGPDIHDHYNDTRGDYVFNEVACDYNAGFQGALAGLSYFASKKDLPAPPPSKC